MKRLLFVSPGNNLVFLSQALLRVQQEQQVEISAENILTYQVSDHIITLDEVRRRAESADIILFDIRAFPELVETLRAVRNTFPEKTFIPLMGGSMDVMTLCRMGQFNFDRFTSSAKSRSVNYRRIQQITHLIDRLGGMLSLGALRHARVWVHVVRYWTAGGAENITNLVRLIVRQYCGGTGPKPQPPRELPVHFLCDPEGKCVYRSIKAYRKAGLIAETKPVIAVLHYSGLHREASLAGLAAISRCLEGRASVLPVATNGVESLEPIQNYLLSRQAPHLDALISLLWFRLDGGPLGGSTEKTLQTLTALDVPLCVGITMYGREIATWHASPEGVSPVESLATVVLPELDGALLPVPVLGVVRQEQDGFHITTAEAIEDRVAAFSERVLAWTRLRHIPRHQKKIALVVYDYPPGPAHAGNASYLDVAQSLRSILQHLEHEGYQTAGAGSGNPLQELLADNIHNDNADGLWQGLRFSFAAYQQAWEKLPPSCRDRIRECFGPAPGSILTDAEGFRIPGRWYGNVLIAFQPARMPGTADSRILHDNALPPHHQYIAFYAYLNASVDAVIHIGTHGTIEFTPGKQLGLSKECFPDLLRGTVPQFYLYTIANPSESSIARRRLQACLISHHLPDFIPAGLYGDYQELLDLIDRYRDRAHASAQHSELLKQIQERAQALDLPADDLDRLTDELQELKHAAIPKGLHVFGKPKDGKSLVAYLAQLFTRPLEGICPADYCTEFSRDRSEILALWAREFVVSGKLPQAFAEKLSPEECTRLEQTITTIAQSFLADRELCALVRALDGRYIEPGLMGDSLRSPQVYPTGRNGCSFDPTRIPFPDAVARGTMLGQKLIERFKQETGSFPRTVGLVLWGFETARSGGDTIGMFLHLIGARLKPSSGWLPAFEPVAVAELGRPRVDVYLMICGFFRDMFPTLVRELDKLIRSIAVLEEPPELNPLRARVMHDGDSSASARIFGPQTGAYGTAIPQQVTQARWSDPSDIGSLYQNAMGHAYGDGIGGVEAHDTFQSLLAATDVVSQVVDGQEYKIGDLDHYYEFLGGACRAVETLRGEKPKCLVADSARTKPRVQEVADELRRWAASRLLNPVWIDGMLAHDLHGAKKIEERVTNLVGLAATVGVPSALFDRVCERFIEDEEIFSRLRENNPHAALSLARRMAEAAHRGLWQASPEQLALVRQRYAVLDADVE